MKRNPEIMGLSFPLDVSYSQVAVFLSSLENPFNNWTERHVAQGFSWRQGSVAFAVPDGGQSLVEVLQEQEQPMIIGEVQREIWVPFEVVDSLLKCGSIADEKGFNIPIGMHQLIFRSMMGSAHGDLEYDHILSFTFLRSSTPKFAILKFDTETVPDHKLLLSAEPAE